MENVATQYRFSLYDGRIDQECHEALPDHPHVAHFIAGALRASDGSVLVARLLCESLLDIENPQEVSEQRAGAFARAFQKDDGLEKIFEHLRGNDKKFVPRSLVFIRSLRETMERENKIVAKEGERPDMPRYRVAMAIKKGEDAHTLFTTIFNTAYAMLSDVPIELAGSVAA